MKRSSILKCVLVSVLALSVCFICIFAEMHRTNNISFAFVEISNESPTSTPTIPPAPTPYRKYHGDYWSKNDSDNHPKTTAAPTDTEKGKPFPEYPQPTIAEKYIKDGVYVLNKNTGKFHHPKCSFASKIKESNRFYFEGEREDVIEMGYIACLVCDP